MVRVLRILLITLIGLLSFASPSAAQETPRQAIDAVRNTLADIETGLKSDQFSDSDLAHLRALNDPLIAKIQTVISDLSPRLEASRKRVAELKPQSKEAQDPNDAASVALKDEQAKFAALDSDLRSARALLLQTDENATRIWTARRELFAHETFARSSSVFSPVLWFDLAGEAQTDGAIVVTIVSNWANGLSQRMSRGQALGFLALLLGLIAVTAPVKWLATRVIARDADAVAQTRLRRAIAAAWTVVVLIALPLAALTALSYALDFFDISDPRLQSASDGIFNGLRLIVLAYAFGKGLLAPGETNWRMAPLGDRSAAILFRYLMVTTTIWGAEKLFEAIAEETVSLNIAIAARATSALLIGLFGARTMRRMVRLQSASQAGKDASGPARTLAWIYLALLLGAAIAGYIAFAAFLINQTLFVIAVGGALYLADAIVQESAEQFLQPDAAFGHGLMNMVGLRREAIEQLVVIVQAFARVAAFAAALVVTFGPIGLPAQDLFATLRAAYFGFTIGGVTISLASMFAAGVAFVVVIVVTRAVQNWLSERFLPRTRLDAGIGNSIRTLTGYFGLVIALLVGGARLGFDLQQFGLIAGALSVGIGFGLQGIVNNFVSGLILLWERGISVGDWVVVGSEQGFVRKINARATEIETFDRATLIVPNLNLVTGVVKNWLHADRVARVIVTLNVGFGADPETVRELMIAAAKSQESVLTIPAPLALFSEFADWSLRFQLTCFVDDALMAERIKSEINFDLYRRMREAGISLALPYPTPK